MPSIASLVLARCHLVQTGKKEGERREKEATFSTISYCPPKSQMHGVTFHDMKNKFILAFVMHFFPDNN